jgi:hypothetical protein
VPARFIRGPGGLGVSFFPGSLRGGDQDLTLKAKIYHLVGREVQR